MQDIDVFDFHRMFLGDYPLTFLLEIIFRTIVMYAYTIVLLRFLGKRGMGQLSNLELAIIICFGSAVGDPMIGADIPIIHGFTAITTVALVQVGMEKFINKNKRIEQIMEGLPECLVDDGKILLDKLKTENLSNADLFRALRNKEVVHLGEIDKAYFETSGDITVFFHNKRKIKPGLSIKPIEDE
ncbi:MAG TPA: YetF domain-containing protein, partial [Daejeonella sp.]